MWKVYPDLHLTVEDQIAEDDLVATRVTMTGTHRGEWPPGAKPTNKPVRIRVLTLTAFGTPASWSMVGGKRTGRIP